MAHAAAAARRGPLAAKVPEVTFVTRRRELSYWAVVFATSALGTALGDFTARVLQLGYLGSAVLFAVVIVVPAAAWSQLKLYSVLCFWAAYVVTRPLGASFADYFGKPRVLSGLGYGDGPVSFVLLLFIAVLVGYTALTRHDIRRPEPAVALPDGGRRTSAGTGERSLG